MDFRSQRGWWIEALRIARRHAAHGCSDAAADLAQDMAVRALERGERTERAGAWLERVARNALVDRHRREQCRQRLNLRTLEPLPVADPESSLLAREQAMLLRRAMGTLPPSQRHVAELRFGEELTLDDVAARLGTVPATTRSRLHRALAALRRQLGHLRATVAFGWPGVQTAALSFAVMAATSPAAVETPTANAPSIGVVSHLSALSDHSVRPDADDRHDHAAVVAPARVTRRAAAVAPAMPAAVQTFRFVDDDIAGDHDGPIGDFVQATPIIEHASLIELRTTLVPEIAKSVEDL